MGGGGLKANAEGEGSENVTAVCARRPVTIGTALLLGSAMARNCAQQASCIGSSVKVPFRRYAALAPFGQAKTLRI